MGDWKVPDFGIGDLWRWATTDEEPPKELMSTGPAARTDLYCKDESGKPSPLGSDGKPLELRPPTLASTGKPDYAGLRAAFDAIKVEGSKATVSRLDRNVDAFASRWHTLGSAKKSFDTTYFIWEKDVFGFAYLGHMYKKAKYEGVAIRGMLDATGDPAGTKSFKGDQDYLEELVAVDPSRVQFRVFNPVLAKDKSTLASAVASDHDKLAIADGERFETGGRNMAAHYFSDPQDKDGVYRDTDAHIESKTAAAEAKAAFDAEFNQGFNAKVTPDFGGNWDSKECVLMGAYIMMDEWLKDTDLTPEQKKALRTDKKAQEKEAERILQKVYARMPKEGVKDTPGWMERGKLKELALELVHNPELRGTERVKLPTFQADVKLLDNTSAATPGAKRKMEINESLIALAGQAKKSIVIHNPYVVLTDKAVEALAAAANRGVQVIFGTNSPESSDSAATQAYFLEDWTKVLARIKGSRILVARGNEKHHAKTFIIDGVITGVSSFNADWISARVNSEDAAVVWSEEFAADTMASYLKTIADPAHKVVEYRIAKDKDGKALLVGGVPQVIYGPECHVPTATMKKYIPLRKAANEGRNKAAELAPLKMKPLDPSTDWVRAQ